MPNHYDYIPAKFHSPAMDEGELGPAMKALNPRRRAFVDYLITNGTDNFTEAAIEAGFEGTANALRVTAHRVARNPAVCAALIEEGKRRVNSHLPQAIQTITAIAGDISHKDALKAALALAAMSGISPIALSQHQHEHVHTGSLLERAQAAAERLGIRLEDIGQMKDVTPRPLIEHKPEDPLDISDLY
jgi:phage terminase small subunit